MASKSTGKEFLDHRDVPYITHQVEASAKAFLPNSSRARLNASVVERFVSETADDPDTRMAVLGVLRTHAANGAEVVLSGTALLISVMGVVLAATRVTDGGNWALFVSVAEVVGLFGVVLWVLRRAGAAHARKLTALVWLAAYEDALKWQPRSSEEPVKENDRRGAGRGRSGVVRWLRPRFVRGTSRTG